MNESTHITNRDRPVQYGSTRVIGESTGIIIRANRVMVESTRIMSGSTRVMDVASCGRG